MPLYSDLCVRIKTDRHSCEARNMFWSCVWFFSVEQTPLIVAVFILTHCDRASQNVKIEPQIRKCMTCLETFWILSLVFFKLLHKTTRPRIKCIALSVTNRQWLKTMFMPWTLVCHWLKYHPFHYIWILLYFIFLYFKTYIISILYNIIKIFK